MTNGGGAHVYNPWDDLASRPHIAFGVRRLPLGHGWWLPDIPGIVLDDRIGRVKRRCVLAHELVHADVEDKQCAATGPDGSRLARRSEAFADRRAAQRLIAIDDLADAIAWAPLNPAMVAEHLDVTEDVLRRRLESLTAEEANSIERRLAAKEEVA